MDIKTVNDLVNKFFENIKRIKLHNEINNEEEILLRAFQLTISENLIEVGSGSNNDNSIEDYIHDLKKYIEHEKSRRCYHIAEQIIKHTNLHTDTEVDDGLQSITTTKCYVLKLED